MNRGHYASFCGDGDKYFELTVSLIKLVVVHVFAWCKKTNELGLGECISLLLFVGVPSLIGLPNDAMLALKNHVPINRIWMYEYHPWIFFQHVLIISKHKLLYY